MTSDHGPRGTTPADLEAIRGVLLQEDGWTVEEEQTDDGLPWIGAEADGLDWVFGIQDGAFFVLSDLGEMHGLPSAEDAAKIIAVGLWKIRAAAAREELEDTRAALEELIEERRLSEAGGKAA